jgi:hypothetical protein
LPCWPCCSSCKQLLRKAHPQKPTGEEWWAEIFPKTNSSPQPLNMAVKQASYRPSDERGAVILIACSKCDWRAAYPRDELFVCIVRRAPCRVLGAA